MNWDTLKQLGVPQDVIDAAKKLGADTEADIKQLGTLCVDHAKDSIYAALRWAASKLGK